MYFCGVISTFPFFVTIDNESFLKYDELETAVSLSVIKLGIPSRPEYVATPFPCNSMHSDKISVFSMGTCRNNGSSVI